MDLARARAGGARLVAAMALSAVVLCTSGCVELFKGPRVVTYTDTSFYIRSIPLLTGADGVGEIAIGVCGQQHRQAVMTDSYQDVPLGLRYSTFACL